MQDTTPLTDKQKKVFDFINSFIQKRGFSPSLQEISKHLGKNTSTAQYYVKELKEKGYLKKSANKARSITPISKQNSIPLLGYISAGKPIEPIEVLETINVPNNIKFSVQHSYYALRVQGDSMMDMGILDDDVVLIQHQLKADSGDVVVAITEDGATLKTFKQTGEQIRLEPRNKDYPTIFPNKLEIRGKFVGLIRNNI